MGFFFFFTKKVYLFLYFFPFEAIVAHVKCSDLLKLLFPAPRVYRELELGRVLLVLSWG